MSFFRPTRTLLQARLYGPRQQQHAVSSLRASSSRNYHCTSSVRRPYKDDQDRESLKPRSTEGTKSGTDNEVAESNAAFDGSKTSPEAAKDSAKQSDSTLDVSGANQGMSKPQNGNDNREMKGTTRQESNKKSGGGSPEKSGKPPV